MSTASSSCLFLFILLSPFVRNDNVQWDFDDMRNFCKDDAKWSSCKAVIRDPSVRSHFLSELCFGASPRQPECEFVLQKLEKYGTLDSDVLATCFPPDFLSSLAGNTNCKLLSSHDATSDFGVAFEKLAKAFEMFHVAGDEELEYAAWYRRTSNCSNETLEKCEEFDARLFEKIFQNARLVPLLRQQCSKNYTDNVGCNYYTEMLTNISMKTMHEIAKQECGDKRYVMNDWKTLKMCYNMLEAGQCYARHPSLACKEFTYMRKIGEFNYKRDYNESDLKTTAEKAVFTYILRQDKQVMETIIHNEKHGMVHLLKATCDDGIAKHNQTCMHLILEVLPTTSQIVEVLQTFCMQEDKNVIVKNTPMCTAVFKKLCPNETEKCDIHYISEMVQAGVRGMNTTAFIILYGRSCGENEPNVTNFKCHILDDLLTNKEELLKKIVKLTCKNNLEGNQCRYMVDKAHTINNDSMRQNCFNAFEAIGSWQDDSEDLCGMLYHHSNKSQALTAEFKYWKQYLTQYRAIEYTKNLADLMKRHMAYEQYYSDIELHYADMTALRLWRARREILIKNCEAKETSAQCEHWLEKLDSRGSLAEDFKELCPNRAYQKEPLCENIVVQCERLINGNCQPIIDYYVTRSYTPHACEQNSTLCYYSFNEVCVKQFDKYRCDPLVDRMTAPKIIHLIAQCESSASSSTCNMVWNRINTSQSVNLLEQVIQGYCEKKEGANWELKKTAGKVCKDIKRMCLFAPIQGCYHIQQRWYPLYMYFTLPGMLLGIFLMFIGLLVLWIQYLSSKERDQRREEMREDFARFRFQRQTPPPPKQLTAEELRKKKLDDAIEEATKERCRKVMEEVKRLVKERAEQARKSQEDGEF